ncbi:Hydrophobin 2 [Metarhizium brunneum]
MKLLAVAALLAGAAIAAPTSNTGGSACPAGLYSNPQCCSADVLGVIGIDCKSPSEVPRDGTHLGQICAKTGDQALCCVAPVVGQALLCEKAAGGA